MAPLPTAHRNPLYLLLLLGTQSASLSLSQGLTYGSSKAEPEIKAVLKQQVYHKKSLLFANCIDGTNHNQMISRKCSLLL